MTKLFVCDVFRDLFTHCSLSAVTHAPFDASMLKLGIEPRLLRQTAPVSAHCVSANLGTQT